MQKTVKIVLFVVISLFLLKIALPLSFNSLPIMDNTTETGMSLYCSWESSPDTVTSNVTWYNSSNLYLQAAPTTLSYSTLAKDIVKRDETWTCKVVLDNGTQSLGANYSIIIKNGRPKNLKLYNLSGQDIGLNATLYEDNSYFFYLNATDPDFDTVKYDYLFDSLPASSVLNKNTGAFNYTPTTDSDAGYYNVTFMGYDAPYLSITSVSILFNVIAVNDPPVFSPSLLNKQATEETMFSYIISATDEESNFPLTFRVINNTLGLNLQALSGTSVNLSFMPLFMHAGNNIVIINVTDSLNASILGQFNINVTTINHIPTITYLENASGTQGGPFLLHINASDFDSSDQITMNITSSCSINSSIWNITQFTNTANNSYGIINVTNLTNDHVICRNVTISVTDGRILSVYSVSMVLNITNVDDTPIIYPNSKNAANTNNNLNIYNLTAYQFVRFEYNLNFTDMDIMTYQGDNVTLSTNFSAFNISLNAISGKINFTTNQSGTYDLYVEALDFYGLKTNKTLNLTIIAHTLPNITLIPNRTVNESVLFNYTINASGQGTLTYYTNSSSLFTIDPATGNIVFIPDQSKIGNYTVSVWVVDDIGGTTYSSFTLNIINKNDPPIIGNFTDFSSIPMVVDKFFYYKFTASDKDLLLPPQYSYDFLTFYANDSIFANLNMSSGVLFFKPNELQIGNYSVTISVNDSLGFFDNKTLNFTVYNVSRPPQIINITPFGTPLSSYTNFSWANASLFNMFTRINISENTTVIFNHTTINFESEETVNYSWYINGVMETNTSAFVHYFDFFTNGTQNITLIAQDSHYSTANFTWVVDVKNINRPVQFLNNPENRTGIRSIIGRTTISEFLLIRNPGGVFYDPDDDLDSNGVLDANETNNLLYSYNWTGDGLSDALSIEINNTDATLTPLKNGGTAYTFTASDVESNATTNKVFFNLTVSNQTTPTQTTTTTSVTRTRSKNVYYPVELNKILTMNILAPKSAVMYENNTVVIPVTIKNIGNNSIKRITLNASSNNSELEMSFEKNYFNEIFPDTEETTNLIVKSFRTQGKYEVDLLATSQDPEFTDTAVVLISSVEKQQDKNADETTKTMITFAKDLLTTNPKCLELNEMLDDASNDLSLRNYDVAQKKIDEVVSACRYLISGKSLSVEQPNSIYFSIQKIRNDPLLYFTIVGILSSIVIGILYSIYYTNRKFKS